MKPEIELQGWVTRDSDDYIKFHTSEPYKVLKTEVSFRDKKNPEERHELNWFCRDKCLYIAHDEGEVLLPEVMVDEPIKGRMKLCVE